MEINIQRQKLSQNIPVVYMWFGQSVPEDYLITLSQLDYPVIFLKNPQIKRKFSRQLLDIEKADFYKLQYIYDYGGIYSDFDNTIDYKCLMNLLEPYRDKDLLVFMTDGKHTRKKTGQITLNLIFAPYPKMPILKKILDSIDEKKQKIWQFAGMKHVGKFEQPVQLQMNQCVKHSYDWSWYEGSNEVLGKSAQPHKHYSKKLVKKQSIKKENDILMKRIDEQRKKLSRFDNELSQLNAQNSDLIKKLKQVQSKLQQVNLKERRLNGALVEKQMELEQRNHAGLVGGMGLILLLMIILAYYIISLRKKSKKRNKFQKISNLSEEKHNGIVTEEQSITMSNQVISESKIENCQQTPIK